MAIPTSTRRDFLASATTVILMGPLATVATAHESKSSYDASSKKQQNGSMSSAVLTLEVLQPIQTSATISMDGSHPFVLWHHSLEGGTGRDVTLTVPTRADRCELRIQDSRKEDWLVSLGWQAREFDVGDGRVKVCLEPSDELTADASLV